MSPIRNRGIEAKLKEIFLCEHEEKKTENSLLEQIDKVTFQFKENELMITFPFDNISPLAAKRLKQFSAKQTSPIPYEEFVNQIRIPEAGLKILENVCKFLPPLARLPHAPRLFIQSEKKELYNPIRLVEFEAKLLFLDELAEEKELNKSIKEAINQPFTDPAKIDLIYASVSSMLNRIYGNQPHELKRFSDILQNGKKREGRMFHPAP